MTRRLASSKRAIVPPTVVSELRKVEQTLGGREALVGMLALAPLTQDLRYVLGMLGDPRNQTKSLAEICADGNILPGDLLKQLSGAALLRGKVKASQHIGDGIAAVAEDVMRRAAPYEATCSTCQGVGQVTPEPTQPVPNPVPGPCETCRGTGRLIYAPDLERQKLAIEMAQLLPKGGGLQILNANVQGGMSAAGGGLGPIEKLQALTDRLLYGSGQPPAGEGSGAEDAEDPPVEGEIVPPTEAEA